MSRARLEVHRGVANQPPTLPEMERTGLPSPHHPEDASSVAADPAPAASDAPIGFVLAFP